MLAKASKVVKVLLGSGFWVLGSGFWVLGSGFWVLGSGFLVGAIGNGERRK
ncbi:Multidrug resistance protein B [Vibrio parahaemolyticus]|nr:Multidrug resistance protein B [Vibrio parahaemolyticus]APE83799.1 Multidrug resistance protein B [Vibrio parahaemolyticus]